MRHALIPSLFFAAAILVAAANPLPAPQSCGNNDGDTITLCMPFTFTTKTKTYTSQKVRMVGIDAPEKKQPYGPQAQEYLSFLLKGEELTLNCVGLDKYKRALCTVRTKQYDLNGMMVAHGYAYPYMAKTYNRHEDFARMFKLGVWAQPNGGVRPWDYRHPEKEGN